ncbi:MAG: hypothetical protein AAF333_06810 [Planctomycetota bacterium]
MSVNASPTNPGPGKPTVCYVVTANADSAYPAMLCISVGALKRVEPEARVALLTTEASLEHIRRQLPAVDDVVDEIVCRAVPDDLPAMKASRYLKTNIRRFVDGPLIFVDVDTLPVRPFLSQFDLSRYDLIAAADLNPGFPYPFFPGHGRRTYEALGWACPTRHYVNSGVMGWADSPAAHLLSAAWYAGWQETSERGVNVDQPSLNHAIDTQDAELGLLPKSYNAMVAASPWLARNAHILHFYTEKGRPDENTVLAELLDAFERTGEVDWGLVDRAARGDVWRKKPPVAVWIKGIVPLRKLWHRFTGARREFSLRRD